MIIALQIVLGLLAAIAFSCVVSASKGVVDGGREGWDLLAFYLIALILALGFLLLASAIEAQRATTVKQGVVHESAVPEGQTPSTKSGAPDNG